MFVKVNNNNIPGGRKKNEALQVWAKLKCWKEPNLSASTFCNGPTPAGHDDDDDDPQQKVDDSGAHDDENDKHDGPHEQADDNEDDNL